MTVGNPITTPPWLLYFYSFLSSPTSTINHVKQKDGQSDNLDACTLQHRF